MSVFLILAFLFFVGSIAGWIMELLFRNFRKPIKQWINPGFCTGPYVPLYGFGLCFLYLIASLKIFQSIADPFWSKVVVLLVMAVAMTLLEYIAGILCLRLFKVRLWDYSGQWGNIQGIICPLFSAIWAVFGAAYYFFIHPYILEALQWLGSNLAFSFVIGLFFGVFLVDVAHSAQITVKLKAFAEKYDGIVVYEAIKADLRKKHSEKKQRYNFFRPFHTDRPLHEELKERMESVLKKDKKL